MPFQQHEQTGLVWFTADVLNEIPHGFSTRKGGVSPAPWDSLNLRPGQGDGPEKLRENYRRFFAALGLDETRAVLSQQTHTANIRTVTAEDAGKGLLRPRDYTDVDALITNVPGLPLTVFPPTAAPCCCATPSIRPSAPFTPVGGAAPPGSWRKPWQPWVRPMGAVPLSCWQRWVPASAPAASRQTEMCRRPCKPHWERMPTPISQ